MTDPKLVEALNSSRMISAAQDVIFPLIQDMISKRLDLACAEYRAGKDTSIHIAYITGLKDLSNELKRLQTVGERARAELNK